ncbi:MAG: YbhB/YbcL family Raf kinase inhibitor-like protein [Thermoguttaceae bacterium]|nr:YbhB/YbcL family Raf kinase inhibitor-like protein [Thermoguttaceae bacterium]
MQAPYWEGGRKAITVLFCLELVFLLGCGGNQTKHPAGSPAKQSADVPSSSVQPGGSSQAKQTDKPKFILTSRAFDYGKPIPRKYTGEGEDLSPPLSWDGVPEGTKEFALICDDPDAPSPDQPAPEPWVHWVIYGISSDVRGLPEGLAKVEKPLEPPGVLQGRNSWPEGENIGYRGPMPPPGKPHRYFFRLYALAKPGPTTPGLTKHQLLEQIKGHILAEAVLMGTYQRQ